MKSKTIISTVFLISILFFPLHGQGGNRNVEGSWLGTLDVGAMQLRLVFNISCPGDSLLEATLDSPDQGASDIPMGVVSLVADSIRIDAPMLRAYYKGKILSETDIHGEWNQAGRSFVLNLEKQAEKFALLRPQEPKPPYPYVEEEVYFENEKQGFSLAGTFTYPSEGGPFPAVVLISGSGSQNRDEEIFGHKPFKVLADHLTRNGIAVLRYDDRGVGSSGGIIAGSTSEDNAGDARSAVDYLLKRVEVNPSRLGLVGHSEGGMISFMLASEYEDIEFIIALAGPGVPGKTILLEQSEIINRLSGVGDSILLDNRIVMGKTYDLMIDNESYADWQRNMLDFTADYYAGKGADQYSQQEIEQIQQNLLGSIPAQAYAWMRYFVMFDPSIYLSSIRCPVLALNGEKDCQVIAEQNILPIGEILRSSGNQAVTTIVLQGLNHLFQNCETGLPSEYGVIEETFDPNTLNIISDWINQQ